MVSKPYHFQLKKPHSLFFCHWILEINLFSYIYYLCFLSSNPTRRGENENITGIYMFVLCCKKKRDAPTPGYKWNEANQQKHPMLSLLIFIAHYVWTTVLAFCTETGEYTTENISTQRNLRWEMCSVEQSTYSPK